MISQLPSRKQSDAAYNLIGVKGRDSNYIGHSVEMKAQNVRMDNSMKGEKTTSS